MSDIRDKILNYRFLHNQPEDSDLVNFEVNTPPGVVPIPDAAYRLPKELLSQEDATRMQILRPVMEEPEAPLPQTAPPPAPVAPKAPPVAPQQAGAGPLDASNLFKHITLNTGHDESGSVANLIEALKAKSDAETSNQILKSANLIGASIAKTTPKGQDILEENIKLAGNIPKQFEQISDQNKKDPNSAYSKGFREYLKRFNISVNGDFTGEMGEKMIPWALTQYDNELHRKTQLEMAKERDAARKDAAADKADEKLDRRFSEMNKMLVAEKDRGNTAFGKNAGIKSAAARIQALVDSAGGPDKVSLQQVYEIAKATDAMVSMGAATQGGTKKLIPHTALGNISAFLNYFKGNYGTPNSANQGAFVRQMLETSKRESDTADKQILETQKKLIGGYSDLEEKDPDRYHSILKLHRLGMEGPQTIPSDNVKVMDQSTGVTKLVPKDRAQYFVTKDPTKFKIVD